LNLRLLLLVGEGMEAMMNEHVILGVVGRGYADQIHRCVYITSDITIFSFCTAGQYHLHPNTRVSIVVCNHDTAGPCSDAMRFSYGHSKPASHSTLDVDDAQ
jgi:hypothetical protein